MGALQAQLDLTKAERDAHIRRYAELLEERRKAELQSGQNDRIESKREDGRGHGPQGIATQIAEETGLSQRTVRRALRPETKAVVAKLILRVSSPPGSGSGAPMPSDPRCAAKQRVPDRPRPIPRRTPDRESVQDGNPISPQSYSDALASSLGPIRPSISASKSALPAMAAISAKAICAIVSAKRSTSRISAAS